MSGGEGGPVDVPKRWATANPRFSVNAALDNVFFVFSAAATIWLAVLLITESFSYGWWQILFFVIFWFVLAYLALPRIHRILTQFYVPNYFIGRARTSDGLLGDPINLALLGSEEQLEIAMTNAGWTRADSLTLASGWRIITATLLRRSYDEAPVSPLMLFDRQQDLAYQQEVRGNPAKRHHVRFWKCPDGWLLPGGHGVDWLAAGTFDRRVGFSLFTLQITHKIDADTDIERDHIVNTLVSADSAVDTSVIRDFSTGYHARNGGGDTIQTDGDLPVIDLRRVSVPEAGGSAHPASRRFVDKPVHEWLEDPESVDEVQTKRPLALNLGVLLMLLRVVAGAILLASLGLGWRELAEKEFGIGLSMDEMTAVAIFVGGTVGIGFLYMLFYLVLAILTFVGKNWARITGMSLSSLVIIVAAFDYFNGGVQIVLQADLTGLPLDILILLALSSQSARAYVRRPRPSRRDRRRARRAADAAG